METKMTLANLPKNTCGRIIGFSAETDHLETRFREIGFAEGDVVQIVHVGLFGGSPINVKLHGTSIAMRPYQAQMIDIELVPDEPNGNPK
jgi:Fe2+ transport system protein FeoA